MGQKTIENSFLKVCVNAHGGELSSIYDKGKKRELIWCGDPAFWNRHAPVLFPMVGACYNGEYNYMEHTYKMGQHGFARDSEFMAMPERETELECWYELVDNETTRAKYPFLFSLRVGHRVNGHTISIMWEVENRDTKEMLFNIGAHPAFNIPKDCSMTDATLSFGGKQEMKFLRIEDPGSGCAYTDKEYTLACPNGNVKVDAHFWDEGVYIFEHGQVSEACLSFKGEPYVKLDCKGFPYFGIWSKSTHPFICLEPWQGRCEAYGYEGDLADKEGIIKLAPGAVHTASYEITVC